MKFAATLVAATLVAATLVATTLAPLPVHARKPAGRAPRATLARARALYVTGKYRKAYNMYLKLARSNKGKALLGLGAVLMTTGKYKAALRRLRQAARDRRVAFDAWTLEAEILIRTGDYGRAKTLLEQVIKRKSMHLKARILLGRLLSTTDKRIAAKAKFNEFFSDFDNGNLSKTNGVHMMYRGMAAKGLKSWQDASDAFEEASKLNPNLQENWIEWAKLAMRKYRVDWADEYLKKVLKINPNNPEALADLAWVEWYAPRSNHHRGRKRAKRALVVNPKNIKAMLYLASLDIFDAKYESAVKIVTQALAINPNHLDALALMATCHYLTGKTADYKQAVAKAMAINSRHGHFFNVISRFVSRHHRYAEAAKLNKEAVRIDPDNPEALAALGINLLRIGDYGMGWFHLKESWRLDQFSHRTYNMLDLHDRLPKKFTWLKAGKFHFLVPKDEKRIIARYVPKVMNRALSLYIRKYKHTPKIPVFMELYDKPADFQTRTFGEPAGAGIMGVCFGRVITAISPSAGRSNWAYVLWHELAHTMHSVLSKWHVPRWFTEGLAEYETNVVKPTWKREYARHLHRMLATNTLPGVLEINMRFTRSKTIMGVILAYYQSTLLIQFMAKKWGFSKLVDSLLAFGRGLNTTQVLRTIFKIGPAAFDAAFKKHLTRRFAIYRKQFDPLDFLVISRKEFQKRLKANPTSAKLQAQNAIYLLYRRKRAAGFAALRRAQSSQPNNPYTRYAQALFAGVAHNRPRERSILTKLIKSGHDSYEGRMRLARMAEKNKDWGTAVNHLAAASKLDPEAARPHKITAYIHKKTKAYLKMVDAAERLALIKHTSATVAYTVIRRNAMLGRWDHVRKFAPQAINTQPFNPLVHEKYAWALRAAKKHKQALFEFESAMLCKPKNPHWIHMGMALSYAALKNKRKAIEHVRQALTIKPAFPQANKLLRRLNPDFDVP